MKIVLALLWLVSAAVAQQCTCSSSSATGFWAGQDCSLCDTTQTSMQVLQGCKGMAFCPLPGSTLTERPEHQRTCHGIGTCNDPLQNPLPCTCNSLQNTGSYCEACIPGFVGWPSCTTPACIANQPSTGSATCNNQGVCSDKNMPKSCGTRFGQPQIYFPEDQTCEQLTDAQGLVTYVRNSLLAPGEVCGKGKLTIMCAWNEKCEDRDEDAPVCCAEGTKLCLNKKSAAGGQCCEKWETCCDGNCCASNSQCAQQIEPYTIPATDLESKYVGLTISAPRWRTPDNKRYREIPRICTPSSKMTGPATIRVLFMPIMLCVTTLISAGLMFKTTGFSTPSVAVPALLIVICACITFFSWLWAYGVLMALSAFVALGGAHKGGSTAGFGLIFQFIALAVLCGGMGLGLLVVASDMGGGGPDYNTLFPNAPVARPNDWAVGSFCKDYFGYFTLDNTNRPPNVDPLSNSSGYCATGFISFVWLAGSIAVSSAVLMLAGSGSAYLDSAPKV